MVGNQGNLRDFVGKDAKHVKIGEWVLAANIATRVGIVVILRQTARKISKYRETNSGMPAVGTGNSRKFHIPSV